ncbi:porin family protein [Chitinophaga nivalis]|uniref:PorT family protein n=1 Tax=Chitinophaga nivalis TaxID=2991709 RepID=A0ABT3INJ2_9BACT|nr:porin family protein [Chitinophaga nivalis]MCW3464843.1 PorT family protein [Chitinophaga nivalis]MCW3485466.1 PorT family protein [Chitinophaga nivalis]
MKKHIYLLALALSSGLYSYAQVTFGVKAGFNAASMSSKLEAHDGIASQKASTKTIPAFHAGVIVDFAISENFSLQPGLFYSSKGSKVDYVIPSPADGILDKGTVTSRLQYLELPINFLYKHQLGAGKIFGGLGPYLAYGLSGKMKTSSDISGRSLDTKFKFKNSEESAVNELNVKPFDAGANFTVGYELNMGLLFSVNYSLGLTNTSPYKHETEKNRYFGVSVGYLFNTHK